MMLFYFTFFKSIFDAIFDAKCKTIQQHARSATALTTSSLRHRRTRSLLEFTSARFRLQADPSELHSFHRQMHFNESKDLSDGHCPHLLAIIFSSGQCNLFIGH